MRLARSSVVEDPVKTTDNANNNWEKMGQASVLFNILWCVLECCQTFHLPTVLGPEEKGSLHFIGTCQGSSSFLFTCLSIVIMRYLLRGLKWTNEFLYVCD